MRFRKRWKLENLKFENWEQHSWPKNGVENDMRQANLKSLLFTVWKDFLGQTNMHMHFLFYYIIFIIIIDKQVINIIYEFNECTNRSIQFLNKYGNLENYLKFLTATKQRPCPKSSPGDSGGGRSVPSAWTIEESGGLVTSGIRRPQNTRPHGGCRLLGVARTSWQLQQGSH